MTSKACTRCREVKPLTEYHRDKNRKDGRVTRCKRCRQIDKAEYYSQNRETLLAYKAEYYSRNRDDVLARKAEYHARPEVKAHNAEYRAEYYQANPHIQWEAAYRRRARAYGFDYLIPSLQSFTREDLIWLHGDRCYHCGGEWDQLDHWPLAISQGGMHALFNAVPSCADCNQRSWRTAQLTTTTDKDN